MLALFRLLQRTLFVGSFALCIALGVFTSVHSAQAATCGFQCGIRYDDSLTAQSSCTTNTDCAASCRQICRDQGWVSTGESVCASRTGRTGFGVCTGCNCIPQLINECDAGGDGATACANDCRTACSRDNLRTGLRAPAVEVFCRESAPTPRCVETSVDVCRDCVRDCLSGSASLGSPGVPADCHRTCTENTRGGTTPPCQGVPLEQAVRGLTSAPSGAVSGSGGSRSRIQSGVSAAANEAATLPPGACVQRAIAADAANTSLIAMSEATFSAASTTWTCRRVCSTQEQSGCVTGGCPGDDTIRCCPPALGIAPTLQCGGRGTTNGGGDPAAGGTPGADGTAGGASAPGGSTGSSGSNSTGAPSTDSSGSSGGSTVVGATNVAADSGGLTRLILPTCIEDGGCQFSDIVQMGLNVIRFLFGLSGVLLLVVFVYAGIEYLIAGDAASVRSAEERIKKALIGLFIMFFGYTLVNFLVGLFLGV